MNQNNETNQGEDLSDMFEGLGNDTKSEEKQQRPTRSSYHGTPKIVTWVIKYSGGLVKNEKQASYVLLGFVTVTVVIVLFLIFGGGSSQPTQGTIPPNQFVPQ